MSEKSGIYKCSLCGNVVSVIEPHDGTLVCCDKEMDLLQEKKEDEGLEKHVPVVSVESGKVIVNVGSVNHPMEEAHFIELIQVLKNDEVIAERRLLPGQKPHAEFCLDNNENLKVRGLCNLHGLWTS